MAVNIGKPQIGKKKEIAVNPTTQRVESASLPGHSVPPSFYASHLHSCKCALSPCINSLPQTPFEVRNSKPVLMATKCPSCNCQSPWAVHGGCFQVFAVGTMPQPRPVYAPWPTCYVGFWAGDGEEGERSRPPQGAQWVEAIVGGQ